MKAAATNNVTANPYQGPATAKRSESHARKVATTQSARPKPTRCAELNCENRPLISYGALPAAPASSSPSDPDAFAGDFAGFFSTALELPSAIAANFFSRSGSASKAARSTPPYPAHLVRILENLFLFASIRPFPTIPS